MKLGEAGKFILLTSLCLNSLWFLVVCKSASLKSSRTSVSRQFRQNESLCLSEWVRTGLLSQSAVCP